MSSEIAINIENLGKCYQIYDKPRDRLMQMLMRGRRQYYREFWALRNVFGDVRKGETVGIIGCNGSGKSTLLQMICGTVSPTEGSIHANGRIAALLELGSGFNPEFTGRENVYMNASILGLQKEEIDATINDILKFANIGDFIDQPIKNYSSGMVVRLAFAVAVNVQPEILVVDEALSVGDIQFQSRCLKKIEEIKSIGSTVLFVSHSASQVEALCDRVIWLHQGSVVADGLPSKIVRDYVNFMMHGINPDKEIDVHNEINFAFINHDDRWVGISQSNNIKGCEGVSIEKIFVEFEEEKCIGCVLSREQRVLIEVDAVFEITVDSPLFAIGIMNALNEPVVHFNSYNIESKINKIQQPGSVSLRFSFVIPPLKPGEYLISIGIDDGIPGSSTVLFHVYDAYSFQIVEDKKFKPQSGFVQIRSAMIECVPSEGGL